jgi:hypothetical protein
MNIPGIVKFIVISAVVYQVLSLRPVKKLIMGFVVAALAAYVRKLLKID